jgi:hypothetical protein
MNRTALRRGWTLIALLLLMGSLIFPLPQPASAAISPDGWSTQTSGTTWTLYGVWGDSSSSIFAVGEFGTILHYDGTSWTPMSTGVTNVFFDVWGSSSDNVFAVGQNGIIMRYDGTSWSSMTSGTGNHLNGVWGTSSSDVFAVGNNGIILRFDGSSWNLMTNTNTSHLQTVWGTASDNVFAAGNGGTVLHYNGSDWVNMAAGNPPNFSGIWGSAPDDVFVVGNTGTILQYDGTSWSPMTSGVGCDLYAVWGTSGNDVFVVGADGRILHYDGVTWTLMDSGVSEDLRDLWGNAPLNAYAVGQNGTILHYEEPAPVVISVDPNYGNQGETMSVTIEGGNFDTATSVDFGADISVDNFTVNGQTEIFANITIDSDAVSGPRDVTVTNPYGTRALEGGFTVSFGTVTGVNPNSGDRGETIEVVISGTNMGAATGLSFGFGIAVDTLTIDSPTQITTQITIAADAMPGPRNVSVMTPGYTAVLTGGFTVVAAEPTTEIEEVSPASGTQSQTLDVTITGTNLLGASEVTFGAGITVNSFLVDSSTQITASITIGETATLGARNVVVTTAGGPATLEDGFAVVAAEPTISEISPDTGIQGETLDVTITGTNLNDATVSFGAGITVNSYGTGSATQIVVNVTIDPAATMGARDVVVTTAGGPATLGDGFSVIAAEPTLTGITPASGEQGETLDVSITGACLNHADAVSFGDGITVNHYSTDNTTEIVVNISIAATATPGVRDLQVTTAGGTAALADAFTVTTPPTPPIPAPSIAGVSPASVYQGQTLDVVVSGANLDGATGIDFGTGVTVNNLTVDSSTQVTASITIGDATAAGARDITITTPGGSATLEGGLTVTVAPPTVDTISIPSGRQGETITVVITGTRLDGATEVRFGEGITVNSYTVDSASQITASITIDEDAETGPRDVSVVTPGGSDSLPAGFDIEVGGNGSSWWLWLLIALAVLLVGLLLFGIWRKKRAEEQP